MEKRKMLVTGGCGFIGSHIVDALVARGDEVVCYDSLYVKGGHHNKHAHFKHADIRDPNSLYFAMLGCDTVFHFAARPRVQDTIDNPLDTGDVNERGTQVVIDCARQARVRRIVFASSGAIYGNQTEFPFREEMPQLAASPYALHKYHSENHLRMAAELYGIETVSVRFFNVYGPRLDPNGAYALVVGAFIREAKAGRPLQITGDGTQTRDFVHVYDIARAALLAADSLRVGRGEVINVGCGIATSVNDLAKLFGREVVYTSPRIEPHDAVADSTKARVLLGWEPDIALEQGIADMRADNGV